jgi:hypothetical protein
MYKYKKIYPVKFENTETLTDYLKESNSLVMLMMND